MIKIIILYTLLIFEFSSYKIYYQDEFIEAPNDYENVESYEAEEGKKKKSNYYNVTIITHAYSIDVIAITNITGSLNCSGEVYRKPNNETVFECKENESCKKCENFTVEGLIPNTTYKFNIKGNTSNVFIRNRVTTDEVFGLYNVTFIPHDYSIDVFASTNITLPLNCSGTVKEKSTDQIKLNCEEDNNCKKCENFTVSNLLPYTDYTFDIIGNYSDVKIRGDVKTEKFYGSYKALFIPHAYSIDVFASTNITLSLNCSGTVKEKLTSQTKLNCEDNDQCKKCENFTVKNLVPSREYIFDIKGNMPNVYINSTVKTNPTSETFRVSFLPHLNSIDVIVKTNITIQLNCAGSVTPIYNKTVVFYCNSSNDCKACKNFSVPKLSEDTYYNFSITGNLPDVYIKESVKTLPKTPEPKKYNFGLIIGVIFGILFGCLIIAVIVYSILKSRKTTAINKKSFHFDHINF